MKLLHLGDLHIGRSLGEFDLYEDQAYILEQILRIIAEQQVDALLIAGDVYDKSVPSEKAVELLDDFIRKLAAQHVNTYLISGNHDSDERLNFGSSLFEASGIHIASKFEGRLKKYTFTDAFGEVHIWLLPFVKASQVRYFYPEADIETYDDAVRTVIANSGVDFRERNVLVAHQFVTGGSREEDQPKLAGSEGASAQTVGTVERISALSMADFDYVALGRIHSPQRVDREHIRYAGSPLKYSLSEVHNHKSVPLITLGEKQGDGYAPEIELLPLKPLRDMRHIKGTMKQLLAKENITDADDYLYVTLTDEDVINDAMGIFQQYYPHVVKIDYENSHTRELAQTDALEVTAQKSFEELMEEFYRTVYGCDMSEEEKQMMQKIAREAGVTDEAD